MDRHSIPPPSRGSKFTEIRNLRTPRPTSKRLAALAVDGTRATMVDLDQREKDEHFMEDCNTKISRHRYAQVVLRMNEQAGRYHSVGVFVEAMLREMQMSDVDVATRAAAGTWGLNLLASQAIGGTLDSVVKAIMPAIYCEYRQSNLGNASTAIRAQVKDPTTIESNPYFTHSMYVEQVGTDHSKITTLGTALHNALQCNDSRRNYVVRTLNAHRDHSIRSAFKAWRSHVRRCRIIALTNESRSKRHEAYVSRLRLQAAFYQWKVLLEQTRNSFLTERLHDAAFQLENAKNQFQLQCYRADRLIQSTKEAKEELGIALERNADLEDTIASLKAQLVQQEADFNVRLSEGVGRAMDLVQEYRKTMRVLGGTRMEPQKYQQTEDHATPTTSGAETVTPPPSTPTPTPTPAPAAAAAAAAAASALDTPSDKEGITLSLLRRWCNSILKDTMGDNYREVKSWGDDFLSGEVYHDLLCHVFPDLTPLPVQESNLEYRLRRIKDMAERCQLIGVLEPEDFLKRREDRIVQAVCELYIRNVDRRWRETSINAYELLKAELEGGSDVVAVKEESQFKQMVEEFSTELEAMKKDLLVKTYYDQELADHKDWVTAERAYLFGERRKGMPLTVVPDQSSKAFWKVNTKSLDDIKGPSTIGSDSRMWSQLVLGPLPHLLRSNMNITSRLFFHYAGDDAKNMSEFAFWRFMESHKLFSDVVSKEDVARHFDRVASPQLATALKAATFGKAQLDLQTLTNVARQEMDIRYISPTQFVELIMRVAVTRDGPRLGIMRAIVHLCSEVKLPTRQCGYIALDEFYQKESQDVIHFFADDLYRVFFFYLKRQETSKNPQERLMSTQDGGRFAAHMALNTFFALLDDCSFLEDGHTGSPPEGEDSEHYCGRPPLSISADTVEDTVALLQDRYTGLRRNEMTFTLFLEALCMLSYFWCPSPLVPSARRLGAFIVLWIKRLSQCHASTTLILGAPPFISLEGGKAVDLTQRGM